MPRVIDPKTLVGKYIAYDVEKTDESGACWFKVDKVGTKANNDFILIAKNCIIRNNAQVTSYNQPRCFDWKALKDRCHVYDPKDLDKEDIKDKLFVKMLAEDKKTSSAIKLGSLDLLRELDDPELQTILEKS
jgi:hypothetical protein